MSGQRLTLKATVSSGNLVGALSTKPQYQRGSAQNGFDSRGTSASSGAERDVLEVFRTKKRGFGAKTSKRLRSRSRLVVDTA